MPEETKKPEEETSEVKETEEGGVEVTLKEPSETEETVIETETEVKKEEKKSVKKEEVNLETMRNKLYAQDRIITRLQQQVESFTKPQTQTTETQVQDDLDKLAQTDWKAAVRKLASQEAQEIIRKQNEQINLQQQQIYESQVLEQSAQSALSRHPELNDNTSEKSQIWFNTLNNNPRWRTSPDGPLLTMYEMENELRKRGYDIDGEIKKRVETETERITRTLGTSLPSSTISTPGNKIVLTKEQKEFCDLNGMKYEDYARTLQKAGGKEGIEV